MNGNKQNLSPYVLGNNTRLDVLVFFFLNTFKNKYITVKIRRQLLMRLL